MERLGYKAIWLTVDAVVVGNRERDIRSRWEAEKLEAEGRGLADRPPIGEPDEPDLDGTAGALLKNDDLDMTWNEVGFSKNALFSSDLLLLSSLLRRVVDDSMAS